MSAKQVSLADVSGRQFYSEILHFGFDLTEFSRTPIRQNLRPLLPQQFCTPFSTLDEIVALFMFSVHKYYQK